MNGHDLDPPEVQGDILRDGKVKIIFLRQVRIGIPAAEPIPLPLRFLRHGQGASHGQKEGGVLRPILGQGMTGGIVPTILLGHPAGRESLIQPGLPDLDHIGGGVDLAPEEGLVPIRNQGEHGPIEKRNAAPDRRAGIMAGEGDPALPRQGQVPQDRGAPAVALQQVLALQPQEEVPLGIQRGAAEISLHHRAAQGEGPALRIILRRTFPIRVYAPLGDLLAAQPQPGTGGPGPGGPEEQYAQKAQDQQGKGISQFIHALIIQIPARFCKGREKIHPASKDAW